MKAVELISENLVPLRITDTVAAARSFLAEQGVTELPILGKTGLHNYARAYALSAMAADAKLGDVIPFNPIAPRISEMAHLYEIVPVFAANDLQVLAVINEKGEYAGIVDQKNIHRQISHSLTYKGMGAIVLLQVNSADFAPSQIARLVEENGAKILGMMVNTNEDQTLQVSIKINTTLVRNIIATFRRFNMKVIDCFLAEDYHTDNQREYESVLRFFDI